MNKLININTIDFCDSNSAYKLFSFLGHIFNILKIVIPIIIIVYGTIDLLKEIIKPDNNSNIKLFIKRLVYGILIYFIAQIVVFIFSLINTNINNKCLKIFLYPNDTSLGEIDIDSVKNKNECDRLGKPYIWIYDECRIDITNDNISR